MRKPECCDEMIEELKEGNLICYLTNVPFTKTSDKPTVYILSDGGHGGMAKISYCPFCGTPLEGLAKYE